MVDVPRCLRILGFGVRAIHCHKPLTPRFSSFRTYINQGQGQDQGQNGDQPAYFASGYGFEDFMLDTIYEVEVEEDDWTEDEESGDDDDEDEDEDTDSEDEGTFF